MILVSVSVVPFMVVLLLSQVHPVTLSCTFVHVVEDGDGSWNDGPLSLVIEKPINSTGDCLRMCTEEYDDCAAAGIFNRSGYPIKCDIFRADDSVISDFYKKEYQLLALHRDIDSPECPYATELFP
ncbi:hypothetical protein GCK32_009308 [Trichostrongylus colubriformis]|uniref:Apple domain-containing protein n=1 Tax=Trichostrongylus colubriformis TaxID=6319 RepID=A0AAN8FFF9_TRICO